MSSSTIREFWGTTATRPASLRRRTPIADVPGAARQWGAAAPLDAGWVLVADGGAAADSIVLDEWGTLWWARIDGRTARIIAECYPEDVPGRREIRLDERVLRLDA